MDDVKASGMLSSTDQQQALIEMAFDSAMRELDTDDQIYPDPAEVWRTAKNRLMMLGLQLALVPIDEQHPTNVIHLDLDQQ